MRCILALALLLAPFVAYAQAPVWLSDRNGVPYGPGNPLPITGGSAGSSNTTAATAPGTSATTANPVQGVTGGVPVPVTSTAYQPTYQLLGTKGGAGSTATGAAVGPVYGGSYLLSVSGTFGSGCSAQLQVLGPDGVTFQNVGTAFTAAGTVGVVMGSTQGSTTPNARMTITGTCTLYASLS